MSIISFDRSRFLLGRTFGTTSKPTGQEVSRRNYGTFTLGFFWPTFTKPDLELIFNSSATIDLSPAYATHLWERLAWELYLEHLTPAQVRSTDTNFHRWVAPMIESLPDSYGAPSVTSRVTRSLRQLKRRVRSAVPL